MVGVRGIFFSKVQGPSHILTQVKHWFPFGYTAHLEAKYVHSSRYLGGLAQFGENNNFSCDSQPLLSFFSLDISLCVCLLAYKRGTKPVLSKLLVCSATVRILLSMDSSVGMGIILIGLAFWVCNSLVISMRHNFTGNFLEFLFWNISGCFDPANNSNLIISLLLADSEVATTQVICKFSSIIFLSKLVL